MTGWRLRALVVVAVGGLSGCASEEASLTGATPATALVGPTWKLASINGQAVVSGSTVTAEFTNESRVAGSGGCNRYFGSVTADTGRLTIGPLGATLMACEQTVMTQEQLFLTTLQAAKAYSVRGDELRLGPSATESTLIFSSR